LADLAIRQNVALRRYDTASSIADRKIQIETDFLKSKLTVKQLIYENNKDIFTKQEQRQFESKLKEEEREYNETVQNKNDIKSIVLEASKNSKISSQVMEAISNAKTFSEAMKLATPYLKTPNTEVVKMGDNSVLLIDKNTGQVIKTISSPTGGTLPVGKNGQDYSGVITTILGSGKFTKDQASAIRNAIQNGEDPFTVVKNNARGILTGTEAREVLSYERAKGAMQDLDNALKEYYKLGGKTNIFRGNFEDVANKLGTLNDPNLVEIGTQISSSLQAYRNAISGTAYSKQEGQEISKVFPNIKKGEVLNDAIIKGRIKAMDSTIDNSYRSVLGGSYDKLKSLEQSKSSGKGSLSDREFVEKSFVGTKLTYQNVVNNTPSGHIPVVDNKTSEIGYITPSEFNASLYTKL